MASVWLPVVWSCARLRRIMGGMDSIPRTSEPPNFRIAQREEAPAIACVINSAFRPAENFFVERDRIDVPSVRSLMEKGSFLIAGDPSNPEGCVYVELRGLRGYIGLLSVDPGRQKTGLGSLLMKAAEAHCARAGCKFVDLQIVNLRQELPSFYRRRGYVEQGTAPFPAEVTTRMPCHFIKMSKPLL